jgi:hypothetical protein
MQRNEIEELASRAASQYGIPLNTFLRLIQQESNFDPSAVSPKGAIGLTQLLPSTAQDLGVNPRDIRENIFGGAQYLRQMMDRYPGNMPFALAAYNAGMGNVDKYKGIPPFKETQNYVKNILGTPQTPRNEKMSLNPLTNLPMMQKLRQRDPLTGLNPLQNFAQALDPLLPSEQRMGDSIRQRGSVTASLGKRNTTADQLEKLPGGKPYADMIRQGADPTQMFTEYQKAAREGGLVPGTLSKTQYDMIQKTNKDLQGMDAIKALNEAKSGYQTMLYAFDNPGGVSDYALTIAFAKILDPGSVVRDSEQAAIANTGGQVKSIIQRFRNATEGGQSLPDNVREEIFAIANNSYGMAVKDATTARNDVLSLATAAGIDPKYITALNAPEARDMESIFTSPDQPTIEKPEDLPPVPSQIRERSANFTEATNIWIQIWNSLSPTNKLEYARTGEIPG